MAQEYSIAPGFDNVGSLAVVTNILIEGQTFWSIQGMGRYDDGEEQVKLSGIHDDTGEPLFSWLSTRMTVQQYEYLLTVQLQGKRSGPVTARTRFTGTTYHNVNAILTMPKASTLTRSFGNYLDVIWQFNLVEVLS